MFELKGFKKITLTIGALCCLSACKETNLESGSLGLTLPKPQLKNETPLSQSLEIQGFLRLEGSCDTRLTKIQLSLDQTNWVTPKSSPDWQPLSESPPASSNDIDCSDGKFDIYLSNTDLQHLWGALGNPASLNTFYLRATGSNANSEIVTIRKSAGADFFSSTATKINVEPLIPQSVTLPGVCNGYRAYLENASGNRDVTINTETSFELKATTNPTASGTIQAIYKSLSDCESDISPQLNLSLPAKSQDLVFFHRFASGTASDSYYLKPQSGQLISDRVISISVTTDTSKRFWKNKNQFRQILNNVCYPVSFELSSIGSPRTLIDASPFELEFTSTTGAQFFSDSACTNAITKASTNASPASSIDAFIKYSMNNNETVPFKAVDLGLKTWLKMSSANVSYDFVSGPLLLDLSVKNTPTKIKLTGASAVKTGNCEAYEITTQNANGTQVPMKTAGEVINLSMSGSAGSFYSDISCTTSSMAPALDLGVSKALVYAMATTTTSQVSILNAEPATLQKDSKNVTINVPERLSASGFSIAALPDHVAFHISLYDMEGRKYLSATDRTITVTATITAFIGGSAELATYLSSGNPSGGSCTISKGSSTCTLLINSTALAPGDVIQISASTGGLTGLSNFPITYSP